MTDTSAIIDFCLKNFYIHENYELISRIIDLEEKLAEEKRKNNVLEERVMYLHSDIVYYNRTISLLRSRVSERSEEEAEDIARRLGFLTDSDSDSEDEFMMELMGN
jgi:hypothetical protein